MKTTHTFDLAGTCPVDGSLDVYEVVVETDRVIPVETILEAADTAVAEPVYQETLTLHLSTALGCRVETRGIHSNVRTVCVCEPEALGQSPSWRFCGG